MTTNFIQVQLFLWGALFEGTRGRCSLRTYSLSGNAANVRTFNGRLNRISKMKKFKTLTVAAILFAGASTLAMAQTTGGVRQAGGAVGNVGSAGGADGSSGSPSNSTASPGTAAHHQQKNQSSDKDQPEGKEPPR
jgi:hypothetical protein